MSSRRRTATNTDANSMDLTLHGTYMVNFPGSDGSPDWWAAEFVALVDAGYKNLRLARVSPAPEWGMLRSSHIRTALVAFEP